MKRYDDVVNKGTATCDFIAVTLFTIGGDCIKFPPAVFESDKDASKFKSKYGGISFQVRAGEYAEAKMDAALSRHFNLSNLNSNS